MDNATKTATECAREIRTAIKSAVKSGALPGATYSVRTRYASLMSEIAVTVTDLPFCAWQITDCADNFGDRRITATDAARVVETTIAAMVRASGYNPDGRHSFVDIKIDREERDGLFLFASAERSGQIARAA